MPDIAGLLSTLTSQGIELWFEGDRLRFRARKGVLASGLRQELAANRTELLAALRKEAGAQTHRSPLSYSQQSLWFIAQQNRDSAAYNVAFALRVLSRIEVPHLRHSLQALIDRHAVLRTCYEVIDDLPVQRVAGFETAQLDLHDAAGISDADLDAMIGADYRRPFDLERGPVMRAALYTRAPEQHVLLLVVHHIAVDGWSLLLLVEELGALLREAAGGAPAQLPKPGLQYTDYVDWQARLLAGFLDQPDPARGARFPRIARALQHLQAVRT